jgi:hypothetical protein
MNVEEMSVWTMRLVGGEGEASINLRSFSFRGTLYACNKYSNLMDFQKKGIRNAM